MKQVLIDMIEIYKPNGVDWMNYEMTRNNPYTYHHVKESRIGGKTTIDNGAILTNNAHRHLNYLDYKQHHIYRELNSLFLMLNRTMQPPTEEYFEEVDYILKKVKQ